jgi:hypothetical protein
MASRFGERSLGRLPQDSKHKTTRQYSRMHLDRAAVLDRFITEDLRDEDEIQTANKTAR